MHVNEIYANEFLVRQLLADQFPQWAELSLTPVPSAGTDNALYRLGNDMVVRLPRIGWAVGQVAKEQRWLPQLAPHLPLAIPVPLAKGVPGAGYPWHWSVYRWLEGKNATLDRLADAPETAVTLANFITALQQIDSTNGPLPGEHNSGRGVPLAERDVQTRQAIAALEGMIDTKAATAVWNAALELPAWSGAPVWLHGDLQSGNLLAMDGKLTAVIDFGCLGVGDPACDLMVAWNLFSGKARKAFRAALAVDEATWARGRAWALSVGLIALPYYRKTNPVLANISRYAIEQVLADQKDIT